jgi:dTDP-glucose 4,6-dehydratase
VVRFGNVFGSRGSVVETFVDQLERGGPLTVCHPEVERFFLSIPEAAQLVLIAGAHGEPEGSYVLEMGKSRRIVDLARDVLRLYGGGNRQVGIVYTGLRPGEKLHEVLQAGDEAPRPSSHELIAVVDVPPLARADITGLCSNSAATLLLELEEYVTIRKIST